jgi:hypothetical protein
LSRLGTPLVISWMSSWKHTNFPMADLKPLPRSRTPSLRPVRGQEYESFFIYHTPRPIPGLTKMLRGQLLREMRHHIIDCCIRTQFEI